MSLASFLNAGEFSRQLAGASQNANPSKLAETRQPVKTRRPVETRRSTKTRQRAETRRHTETRRTATKLAGAGALFWPPAKKTNACKKMGQVAVR